MKKYFFVALIVCVSVIIFMLLKHHNEQELAALRFSNTQVWDVEKFTLPPGATVLTPADAPLPPPPLNLSTTTQAELDTLHNLTALRTPEKLAEIRSELFFDSTKYNGEMLQDIFTAKPRTFQVFQHLIGASDPVLLTYKKQFDRVRPSYLDPTLTTAITVPTHAAYPSGHATESKLISLMFSYLDPKNSTVYEQDAKRVAHNREIAGVHYASDSAAGVLLATQLFDVLLQDSVFTTKLDAAKIEW